MQAKSKLIILIFIVLCIGLGLLLVLLILSGKNGERKVFLFSTDAGNMREHLEMGEFPEELRELLENEGYKLPSPSKRIIVWQGMQWQLLTGDNRFIVEKEGETIKVYEKLPPVHIDHSVCPFNNGETYRNGIKEWKKLWALAGTKVTLKGKAVGHGCKLATHLQTEQGIEVYVEDWPRKIEGQEVIVTGLLKLERIVPEAIYSNSGWSQGIIPGNPLDFVLENAKWKLACKDE